MMMSFKVRFDFSLLLSSSFLLLFCVVLTMYLEGGAGGIIGTSASSLLISFVRILGIGFNMVFFV